MLIINIKKNPNNEFVFKDLIVGGAKVEKDFLTDFVLYNYEKRTFLDALELLIK